MRGGCGEVREGVGGRVWEGGCGEGVWRGRVWRACDVGRGCGGKEDGKVRREKE